MNILYIGLHYTDETPIIFDELRMNFMKDKFFGPFSPSELGSADFHACLQETPPDLCIIWGVGTTTQEKRKIRKLINGLRKKIPGVRQLWVINDDTEQYPTDFLVVHQPILSWLVNIAFPLDLATLPQPTTPQRRAQAILNGECTLGRLRKAITHLLG
jgi:hypothetical protein